jgi:radical SAM protein with 4Fe4S-binding SPASM domain
LDTEEGLRLLEELRGFSERGVHLVMTGGDPLKRPDFFELFERAVKLGLRTSVAPSGTNNLTRDVIFRMKDMGVDSMALSIDGSNAEKHDGLRCVLGCFDRTLEAAHDAGDADIPLQINTLITADAIDDLESLYDLVCTLKVARWSLFMLVATGRGTALQGINAQQCESFFHWIYDHSRKAPFAIATTEAPHYRRVALARMQADGLQMADIRRTPVGMGFGIRDGNGVMFISHVGEVYPSGFLPLVAGNVRKTSPVQIYRDAEIFRNLRDTEKYVGRCGRCEFRDLCGGSRARALAMTGNAFDTDPLCVYEPAATA